MVNRWGNLTLEPSLQPEDDEEADEVNGELLVCSEPPDTAEVRKNSCALVLCPFAVENLLRADHLLKENDLV